MTKPRTMERPCDTAEDRGSTRTGALVVHWRLFGRHPTLVTVRVENTLDRPRRLRLDNRLDGPIDPPRRHGVAEPGWDEAGLTRTVPGGETVAIGYACHAPPETPPVDVRDGPAGDTDSDPVEAALRSLGDAAPPRAALPDDPVVYGKPTAAVPAASADGARERPPNGDVSESLSGDADTSAPLPSDADTRISHPPVDAECRGAGPDPSRDDPVADAETPGPAHGSDTDPASPTPTPQPTTTTAPNTMDTTTASNTTDTTTATDGVDPSGRAGQPADPPRAVTAWFDAVDARVATADRLSGDARDATPVVASLGGRAGIETLAATLDDDAAALREVATRAAELAERVAETTVPDVEGDW